MVKTSDTFGIDPALGHPERTLAFGYAPRGVRTGLEALFAFDAMLAKLARHTREPIAAQLRLAWWREAVAAAPIAGQPILAELRRSVMPAGVDAAALATIVDGWEALVLGDVAAFARDRGRALFGAAARVLGASDPWLGDAGEGWALADLALSSPDPGVAAPARKQAAPLLDRARPASRAARPLGALALIARLDLAGARAGSPARVARLLRFRVTGR